MYLTCREIYKHIQTFRNVFFNMFTIFSSSLQYKNKQACNSVENVNRNIPKYSQKRSREYYLDKRNCRSIWIAKILALLVKSHDCWILI